jgi:hypothetical protein
MMMKMNKKRKKSGMSMDKGMKMAKSTKKGMAGDDMYSMDSMPMSKMGGGMMGYAKGGAVGNVSPRKKMAMGYSKGGMVDSRGNGAARGKKTRIC